MTDEKEVREPLLPSNDMEKQSPDHVERAEPVRQRAGLGKIRWNRLRSVLFLTFTFFVGHAVYHSWASSGDKFSTQSLMGGEEMQNYWRGLLSKGARMAVPCSSDLEEALGASIEANKHHEHKKGTINMILQSCAEGKKGHKKHEHPGHSHKHDHKHGHGHKHDGDHKHGRMGHHRPHGKPHGRMPFVPPKMAEHVFLSVPNNDSVAAASKRYTSYAHPAGSGFDKLSALNLKNEWERALGIPVSGPEEHLYDAGSPASQARVKAGMGHMGVWTDTYFPVMNDPVSSSVTLMTDPPFHAKLQEDIVEGDPTSVLRDAVRVFHGLSASGDVTGKFVYAGYGRKADFDLLESKGVNLTGTIAITKYFGDVFRGLKIKAAQEAGAIGCIIYSDPGDDGETLEENGFEVYPEGPARQHSSVQRGSVQFLSIYPGDPTTPGAPAYPNATRIEGDNWPSIPSLPMSFEDILPILKQLEGKGIKASELGPKWLGGLEFFGLDYYTGPSEVDLHLVNKVNTRVMPIWNTMATIPGFIKDEVIVLGNHRDAWVLGGSDPNSGTATQYEMVRGLGKLLKMGWRPLRTILLCSWDAEEYGLVGSVEWAEDFGEWMGGKVAAYLNLDSSVAGQNFGAQASPSLADVFRKAAEEINTSEDESRSVWDTQKDAGDWTEFWTQKYGFAEMTVAAASGTGIGALGSGSDFTAFLERYGIASGNMGYGPGPTSPAYHYHSIYDSHLWQAKFADPGFHRHTDAAKVLGLILLRLADSLLLPLNTTQYAFDLTGYLKNVESIATELDYTGSVKFDSLQSAIETVQSASQKLDEKAYKALSSLRKLLPKRHKRSLWTRLTSVFSTPPAPQRIPLFDDSLYMESPTRPARHCSAHASPMPTLDMPSKKMKKAVALLKEIRAINKKKQMFESGLIDENGLKDREWYRHKGTGPGIWLGYGATTFPALTEAMTIYKDAKLAQEEADILTGMINTMADRLSA